jgi:hypothetical protein
MPEKLRIQLDALAHSGAAWCYTDYGLMDEHGSDNAPGQSGFQPLNGPILEPLLLQRTAAYVGTLLIRRELVAAVGNFDETMTYYEDLEFELRLAAGADAIAVAQRLVRVRRHPRRKTGAMTRAHEHAAQVYDRLLARRPGAPVARLAEAALARHLADGGKERIRAGQMLSGAAMLVRSLWVASSAGHWLRRWRGAPGRRVPVSRATIIGSTTKPADKPRAMMRNKRIGR